MTIEITDAMVKRAAALLDLEPGWNEWAHPYTQTVARMMLTAALVSEPAQPIAGMYFTAEGDRAWSRDGEPAQPADAGGEDADEDDDYRPELMMDIDGDEITLHVSSRFRLKREAFEEVCADELGLVPRRIDPEDMDLHASVQSILDQQVWSDLKSADELTTEVLATIAEYQNGSAR